MNKPTVHVISKYFFPVAAGIETNVGETYKVLAKNGWNVQIHTSRDTLTESNVLAPKDTINGIHVTRYHWHPYGYWPSIDLKDADVIALHNFNVFPHVFVILWTMVLRLLGKKAFTLVLTPHGGFTPKWSTFPPIARILKWLYHRTVAVALVNAGVDGVRAVSEWEKQEMAKYGMNPQKIRVIDNGIENMAFEAIDSHVSKEFKNKIRSYGRYLIQIGRIHKIKNFETTIAALTKLPKDVKFVIAGPIGTVSYKQELEAQIKRLGLQDRVIFFGVVREYEKYYLIKQAQMMVHMAIWESYCNVVHEGMSQGLVCLVADNTALPLLIKEGKNGYCLPTFNVEKLAKKIQYVLDNKDSKTIQTIEETNREHVKQHSWSNVGLRMEQFYKDLMR